MIRTPPSVNIVRLLYVLVCEVAGLVLAFSTQGSGWEIPMWAGLVGGLVVAGFFILVETLIRGFTLRGFSTATFGLLVGLFCAFLLTRIGFSEVLAAALDRQFELEDGSRVSGQDVATTISLGLGSVLYASLGFLGAVLALRSSRDDFAFVLPYVRFRQDGTTGQPVVLDARAITDGRVAGLVSSGFLAGRLIVPRFVLDALQEQAESEVPAARQQARRGLELLESLQTSQTVPLSIEEVTEISGDDRVEQRLVLTAEVFNARLLTPDANLSKIARLRGVEVMNPDELLEALRPSAVVGERIRLALVRPGKEEHQAIGYLTDGTMIVVNHAAARVGSTCTVRVASTLQTSNGLMVFAEVEEDTQAEPPG